MYNKDKKESGYAFFDVEADRAEAFVAKPHLVRHALINCKIAADNSQISQVQKDEMNRKLYVSNLPPGTSDLDLFRLFEPFGKLAKAYLVRNRADGSCKNFGFVIFQEQGDAERLLTEPPALKFRHRKVTVKQAVDRQTQKQLKKPSPTPHFSVNQRYASDFGDSSSKALLLAASRKLNEEERNYKFNLRKRRRAEAVARRADSELITSQSLTLNSLLRFSDARADGGLRYTTNL